VRTDDPGKTGGGRRTRCDRHDKLTLQNDARLRSSRSNQADTTDPPLSGTAPNRTRRTNPAPPGTSEPAFNGAHEQSEDELPLDVTFEIRRTDGGDHPWVPRKRGRPDAHRGAAEHIAAIENNIDTRQLDSQQRKRVYIGLYQCHLPKMDDAGVIEYNQTRGLVETNDSATPLYEYLDPQEPEPQGGTLVLVVDAASGANVPEAAVL